MPILLDNTSTGTLTLQGPASGTSNLIFPPSNGTNGQVLTTDGSGNLSWTNAAGAYTLPTATNSVLGGIKIGSNLAIDGNGVLSVTLSTGSGTPGGTANTSTQQVGESSDPFFNKVALGLHMDGANGSTVFLDVKGHTFSAAGTAQISTVQSKFGGASGYFDGNTDVITTTYTIDMDPEDKDFTIEMWVYPLAYNTFSMMLAGTYSYASDGTTQNAGWSLQINSTGVLEFGYGTGGAWTEIIHTTNTIPLNTWTHIAVARHNGSVSVYLNGTTDTTAASTHNITYTKTTFYMGCRKDTNAYLAGASYNGYIDDFRLTKGVARYTTNFTPATHSFYDTAPTVYDPYFDATLLLLHLDGTNGSTTFTDVKGHTIAGSGNAQISTTQSKFGGASAVFDGAGDYITGTNADYAFGQTTDFTIEFWAYPINGGHGGSYSRFLQIGPNSTAGGVWIVTTAMDNPTTVMVQGHTGGTYFNLVNNAGTIANNTWHHIALVRRGSTYSVYINGTLYGSSTTTYNITQTALYIGSNNTGGESFNGYIDDVRITKGVARYTTNFSVPTTAYPNVGPTTNDVYFDNDVLLMHMDGANGSTTFTDVKGKSVTGTGSIAISTTQSKFGGASTFFNGTSQYLSTANHTDFDFGSGNWTIEGWFYCTDVAGLHAVINKADTLYNSPFRIEVSTSSLQYLVRNTDNTGWAVQLSAAVSNNTWYHFAMTRYGTNVYCFLNGALVGTGTMTGAMYSNTEPVYIGYTPFTNDHYWYVGYIDEIRITKGVARYTTSFTPATQAFADTIDAVVDVITPTGGSVQWNSNGDFGGDTLLIWDDVNNRLGINKATPVETLDVSGNISASGTIAGSNLTGTNTGDQTITLSGDATGSGTSAITVTLNTVPIAKGGTGQTTATAAFNALAPSQTTSSGMFLTTDGTNTSWATVPSGYTLPIASTSVLGGVKIGNNLAIDGTGVLSVTLSTGSGVPGGTANTTTSQQGDPSDPFFDNVVLGLHVNGTNGSTTFTDVKGHAVTPTGNVQISTIQSKFGGASASFDGTGDYISTAASADFHLTSDFTLEAWVYATSLAATNPHIISITDASGNFEIRLQVAGSPAKLSARIFHTSAYQVNITGTTTIDISTWYHTAFVRSGNTHYLYLNGILEASVTVAHTVPDASWRFFGGYNGVGGDAYCWTGYIDDFRVTKGVARYTTDFSVPTATFYDAIPTTYDPYFDNTTLSMHMDGANGSTTFTDVKGHTITPTGSAQISTAQSKFGGASYLKPASTASYITTNSSADFGYGVGDFTIEFWIYATAWETGLNPFVDQRPLGTNGAYPTLYFDTTAGANTLKYYINSGARIVGGNVTLNAWHHIALCRSSGITRLFIDGTQTGSNYLDSSNIPVSAVRLGGWSDSNGTSTVENIYLDDVRITKGVARYVTNFTPLTVTNPDAGPTTNDVYFDNIALLMHMDGTNGSTTFTDVKGNTVTPAGNAQISTTQSKFGGASALFDGTGDYLSTPYNASTMALGTENFTIECWCYPTGNLDTTTYDIWSTDATGSRSLGIGFNVAWGAGRRIRLYAGSDLVSSDITSTLTTNAWHHIAVTRNGTTVTFWLDGVNVGTATSSASLNATSSWFIGCTYGSQQFFVGYLDDVRITRGIARYTTNFTPPTLAFADTSSAIINVTTPIGGSVQWNSNGDFGGDTLLIWDDVNNYLGVNKATPTAAIDVVGNIVASGTITGSNLTGTNTGDQTANSILPSQTGHNSKFLTTDGSNVSWAAVPSGYTLPIASDTTLGGIKVGNNLTIDGTGVLSVTLSTGSGVPGGTANTTTSQQGDPSDPFFDSVVLGLHMDGTDGSTTFTDTKGHTITPGGTVQISITQSKFGGASGRFQANGYLTLPSSTDFAFGTDDFTIEGWVYPSGTGTSLISNQSSTNHFNLYQDSGTAGRLIYNNNNIISITTTANTWQHIAIVRNKTTLKVYVNGVQSGSTYNIGTNSIGTAGSNFIGGSTQGHVFSGYMDDIRYTRGVARYTTSFTPPTATFYDVIPSTYDPYFNNTTLSLHMDGTNGSTAFTDVKGHTVTPAGNAQLSTTQSKFGGASALFDGTGDSLVISDSDDFAFGAGNFTVEGWFWLAVSSHTGRVVYKGASGTYAPFLVDFFSGAIRFYASNGAGWTVSINGTTPSINTWHHFAAVRNGTHCTLYLDGVSIGDSTALGSAAVMTDTNPLTIGADPGGTYFNGYLDDIRITKGIARYVMNFTAPTVANHNVGQTTNDVYFDNTTLLMHMNGTNGSTTFTDVKGKTVTPAGNAQISTAQSKFGGASALFDGTDDYLSIPDTTDFDFGTEDFTIEAWVYIAADSALDSANLRNATIFANQQSGDTTYYALRIIGDGTTTGTGLALETSLSGVAQGRQTVVSISKTVWHHLAVSKNSLGVYFCVDGTIYTAAAFTQAVNGGSYPSIGRTNLAGWYRDLNGYIDDIRITKGVARYVTNFTPPTQTFADTADVGVVTITTPIGGSVQWNSNGDFGGDTLLIWDDVNNYLGVNKATPTSTLDVVGNIAATGTVTGSNINADSLLPSQTGNSGKYLTTNGSNVSWGTPPTNVVDYCKLTLTAAQNITRDSGQQLINFDTAPLGDSAFFSATDNGFKIPVGKAGYYQIHVQLQLAPGSGMTNFQEQWLYIFRNGTAVADINFSTYATGFNGRGSAAFLPVVQLNDGDIITFKTGNWSSTNDTDAIDTAVTRTFAYLVRAQGNTYSLPTASTSVLGGVKIGNNLAIDGNSVLSSGNIIPGGRLTLTTGTPITTSNVTAATTIYYTPYIHNQITLWDGTRWIPITFTETSLALGTLTNGLPYDVFAYVSVGNLTLEMLAWTSGTTRATGISIQDGRYCKTGDKTRLYVGTFYTSSTTTTEDSETKRYVFNMYNRVQRTLYRATTTSTGYTSTAIRDWGGAVTHLELMLGEPQSVTLHFIGQLSGSYRAAGISLNQNTTIDQRWQLYSGGSIDYQAGVSSSVNINGFNYFAVLEQGAATGDSLGYVASSTITI